MRDEFIQTVSYVNSKMLKKNNVESKLGFNSYRNQENEKCLNLEKQDFLAWGDLQETLSSKLSFFYFHNLS